MVYELHQQGRQSGSKGQDGLDWCKLRSLEGGASPLKVKDANIDKALHTLLNPIWWPAVPEQGWLQQEREVGAPSEDLGPDDSLVPEYPKNLFFFDR